MRRAGIVLHATRPEASAVGAWIVHRASAQGVEFFALERDAARLGGPVVGVQELPSDLDLVFVLGGDGTLLRAAEMASLAKAPLLGVNIGNLGFLSAIERADLEAGMQRLLDHGFEIEERTALEGEIDRSRRVRALNDIIVAKLDIGRSVRLSVSIGGQPFVSWGADGVIVATPTGSTAYSLSVGGPIVSPRLDCLIVTPVAPHGLFDRSLVVPHDEEISIRVLSDVDAAALSVDGGSAIPLQPGSEITVRSGADPVRLARLAPSAFWGLVRDKFRLSPTQ